MKTDSYGYPTVSVPGRGRIRAHTLVAEAALGKRLPPGACVHHVDEDRTNNEPSNIVICQDNAYHRTLHRRMRAKRITGNANARFCRYCKRWGDPRRDNMYTSRRNSHHRECDMLNSRRKRRLRREAQ